MMASGSYLPIMAGLPGTHGMAPGPCVVPSRYHLRSGHPWDAPDPNAQGPTSSLEGGTLARAKNTSRAEARRNYRDQVRAAGTEGLTIDGEAVETMAEPAPRPSMFRMPNIREDLRILPEMFRTRRLLWLPFILLLVTFVAALLWIQGVLPTDLGWLVSLAVELLLRPTGLFIFFIGGFLAPRASYLVGAILGLIDGILWAALGFLVPGSTVGVDGTVQSTSPITLADAVVFVMVAVVVGILAASFAAWYRNFLRSSQERARQNRVAREQERAAKAKADAKAARQTAKSR